jgi:hypothetical protein
MKRLFPVLFFILFCKTSFAQTIEFHFPHLAGSEYLIYLNKGTLNDTIQRGLIDTEGRLTFTLPETNRNYTGFINWSLPVGTESIILNNENVLVSSMDAFPDESNIAFANSKENDFLIKQMSELRKLFQKTEAISRVREAFDADNALYQTLQKESVLLEDMYKIKRDELTGSDLYAARYIEILNYLNGFGSYLFMSEQEKIKDNVHFISNRLDMDVLYSSGLWNYVISSTFDLYPNNAVFGQDMVKNLQRTRSQEVFNALASDLITICEQFGWSNAEDTIVSYLATSGKIENPTGNLWAALELNKVKPGSKAAPIKGIKNLSNTILIFYESGCSSCETQLDELIALYPILKEKRIRVVSIASDRDKQIFEQRSNTFPWSNKLCDFKGYEGENFINYHIMGTPTIFFIDSKGNISGRYAKLQELEIKN